jgi:uncharacterized protein with HEPN domain
LKNIIDGISSSDQLLNDYKTYDAVLMNFVIIAEACNRISPDLQIEHSEIPWKNIRGFRNFIAHDYFGVDIDVVWQSLIIELPKLKMGLQRMLEKD